MRLKYEHWQRGEIVVEVTPMRLPNHFYDASGLVYMVGAFTSVVLITGQLVAGEDYLAKTPIEVGHSASFPVDRVVTEGDLFAGVPAGPRPMILNDIRGHYLNEEGGLSYHRIYCSADYPPMTTNIRISGSAFTRKHGEARDCHTLGWLVVDKETSRHWFEACPSWSRKAADERQAAALAKAFATGRDL